MEYSVNVLTDVWFWAFVAMSGLQAATFVVSGHRLGGRLDVVAIALLAVTVGRFALVLPMCEQPRFDFSIWNWVIGGAVLIAAGVIGLPTLSIKWWQAPESHMRLRRTWPYNVVRHPMYLSELLWPIGWSIVWGSIYGLILTPFWCIAGAAHILTEEKQLEEQLGTQYQEYKNDVPWRILPWIL